MANIGVLALQGGYREHRQALEAVGATVYQVRSAEDLDQVEGLVIPGGESTTISLLAVNNGLHEPIRQRIADGMPAFGSCAGMIMLADEVLDGRQDRPSFGGIDMTVRRNAFGRQIDSFETGLEIPAIGPQDFPAVFIRAPWVERVGKQVTVLSQLTQPDSAARIVAVRQANLLATAFHPELTPDTRIHALFCAIVKGEA